MTPFVIEEDILRMKVKKKKNKEELSKASSGFSCIRWARGEGTELWLNNYVGNLRYRHECWGSVGGAAGLTFRRIPFQVR